MARKKEKKKGKKVKKEKKSGKKFPPKLCRECQSENIHYDESNDSVYCRDCGAIMTRS